jgi:hypothetical protein
VPVVSEPGEKEDVENYRVRNVFCPTGEGGGIDPSCSPGGGIQLGRPMPGMSIKTDKDGITGEGKIDEHTNLSYLSISKHNNITPEQIDGEHELSAIKETMKQARAFWSDQSPDAKAIRKTDRITEAGDARTTPVSLNVIMTGDKSNLGAGSGGPGSAKVFWNPYSNPDRDNSMGLGVDPIYVLGHEVHHAFGHDSELDHSSDVVAAMTHLASGLKYGTKPLGSYLYSQVAMLTVSSGARANAAGRRLRYLHKKFPNELKKALFDERAVQSEQEYDSVKNKFESIGKRKTDSPSHG